MTDLVNGERFTIRAGNGQVGFRSSISYSIYEYSSPVLVLLNRFGSGSGSDRDQVIG